VKVLIILNDAPHGTERSYNGLRLALAVAKLPDSELFIFLMADAVFCGKHGQTAAEGYLHIEHMLRGCAVKGATIGAYRTCMDTRGLTEEELAEGVRRSSMAALAEWTAAADKVLVW